MVSHVSHSVHVPPKEHIYTKGGQDSLRTVQDSGDGLTCLTFVHVPPKEHLHQRWARIVETVQDSWDGLTCLTFGACT
jgi:hypothetical protein